MTRHWRRSLSDNGASGTPTDHHKKNRTYSETCTCKRSVSFMKESCRTLLVADPRSGAPFALLHFLQPDVAILHLAAVAFQADGAGRRDLQRGFEHLAIAGAMR